VVGLAQNLLRHLRGGKGQSEIEYISNAWFRVSIGALLRRSNRHEDAEKMLGHDDMAVNREARLVQFIKRLPHVANKVREGLVRALNAYELTGHAHGMRDALGVQAVTKGVPRRGTTIKLGDAGHVKGLAGAAVIASTLKQHGLNDV
jgi:hypothetical protein